MQNNQNSLKNLRPGQHIPNKEESRKGGINSGISKRARKARQERIKELFALAIKNPKMIKNLEAMGIAADQMDVETAMDARMAIKVMQDADTGAYKALKTEAYGPMVEKQELEIGGEINGININVKKFDGENKDGSQH